MKRKWCLLVFAVLISYVNSNAQKNLIDGVEWIVGDEVILRSDIEESRINAELRGDVLDQNWRCLIAEQLAVQKLFLHQADIDSIYANEAGVSKVAEEQENYYLQAYGSKERLEEYARKSIKALREMWRQQARDQQRMDEVRMSIVKNVKVTPAEVRSYFKDVPKDSLPIVPMNVEVQLITLSPKPTRGEIERIENELRSFAQRVNSGESDFGTLAMLYSQDASARQGGELGYKGRGQFVPEFANVAFSLNDPKKVSKIVRTEYGYHIIQLIDKKGDKVNVRHILLKPEVSSEEVAENLSKLDSVRSSIHDGKMTFEEAVVKFSDDKDTRSNNGLMVNIDVDQATRTSHFEMKDLPQDVAKQVSTLEVGEMSAPFEMINKNGERVCALIRLKSRIDTHVANMQDDFQVLKNILQNRKQEEEINKWIEQKQRVTYIRMSPEWRNCKFKYPNWVK